MRRRTDKGCPAGPRRPGAGKGGFYTVEAAVVLPVLLLAMLTLGYFIRVEGIWENVIHGAVDETSRAALRGYDEVTPWSITGRVRSRILEENRELENVKVSWSLAGSLGTDAGTGAYRIHAETELPLALGFGHRFQLDAGIRYRNFTGKASTTGGMGREGLESSGSCHPVVVFPQSGEKYHTSSCTYVKASVEKRVLTGELKQELGACGLCRSGELENGSIVWCFRGEGTAYHRSSCSCIVRHTVTMDRQEAIEKGYTPCSKCGGG